MTILISPQDQKDINQLRIDLAQAVIDLAEVQTRPGDLASRHCKEKAIEGLRMIRRRMDNLGIKHACQLRSDNGQR